MSALDRPKIEDALRVIADAENVLSDVCHGRRRFEMCVPVQATDTDIVIGNALFIGRQLSAENARLREALTDVLILLKKGDTRNNITAWLQAIIRALEPRP